MHRRRRGSNFPSKKLVLEKLKKEDELVLELLKLLKDEQTRLKAEETVFQMMRMEEQGGIVSLENPSERIAVGNLNQMVNMEKQYETPMVEDDPICNLNIQCTDFGIELEKYL